jgi:hypothetical protein
MERSRIGAALPTETVLALRCVQAFGQDGDRAIAIGVLTWFVTHLHECALCWRLRVDCGRKRRASRTIKFFQSTQENPPGMINGNLNTMFG